MSKYLNKKNKFNPNDKKDKKENSIHIPLYNDDEFNKELEKQKKSIEEKQLKEAQEEARKLKEEAKNKLIPLSEINQFLLLASSFSLILMGVAIFDLKLSYIVSGIISIIVCIYIGRRLKINYDETLNVLLWNVTQTLKDFIEYKIPFDLYTDNSSRVKQMSILFTFIVATTNSNNILYGFGFIFILITYLISFSYRDTDTISFYSNKVVIGALFGLIFKTIVDTAFNSTLTIDFMNIIVVLIFVVIEYLTSICQIYEPEE